MIIMPVVARMLEKVLTFRLANLPDYRRVALQTFKIAIELLSFFKTRVALPYSSAEAEMG